MNYSLKKVLTIIIVLFSLVSCKKSEVTFEDEVIKPAASKKVEFGFKYSDFNVVRDTIKKGDTFSTIIEKQNIGNRKVFDIVKKVKDSFDVRTIRINKRANGISKQATIFQKLIYAYP